MAPSSNPRFALLTATAQPIEPGARDHALVLDHRTGLMWPALHLPEQMDLDAAERASAEFRLGGFRDWRAPECDELSTIIDRSRREPAIDTDVFPNTPASAFWSRTPLVGYASSDAWIVHFYFGYVGTYSRSFQAFVRPVRSVLPAGQ